MSDSLRGLQDRLGYQYRDPALLELALSHRSCGARNNERLEFLGDAVLNQIIAEALYRRFPDAREGELSRARAALVKGETLAEIAREMNLGDYIRLGHGENRSGGWRRDSILADAVEALIGSIWLDADMASCQTCVLIWFGDRLQQATPVLSDKDPKSRLQELLQGRGQPLPEYELVEEAGEEHRKQFTIACHVAGLSAAPQGRGSSRQRAEQLAASRALAILDGG